MDLLKKRPVRIAEIFEDRFIAIPDSFENLIDKLSRITTKLSVSIFKYFSTETGRRNIFKSFSIQELKKKLNVSESSIRRAINEIIDNKIFLVYQSPEGKTFDFFITNTKNKECLEKLKTGEAVVITKRYYMEKQDNIFEFVNQKSKTNFSKIKTSPSNLNENKSILNEYKVTESIDKTDIEPISKSPLEYLHKENYIKEQYIQEKKESDFIKKEPVILEKNVCNDFKNFEKYDEDFEDIEKTNSIKITHNVKNDIEDVLSNFGIKTSKVKNLKDILELPKNIIYDTIEKVKDIYNQGKSSNKQGLALSILTKEIENNKTNPYEQIKKAEEKLNNAISEDLKNRFVSFFVDKKLVFSNRLNILDLCYDIIIERSNDIPFLKELKTKISYDELKTIFEYELKTCYVYRIKFTNKSKEILDIYMNIDKIELKEVYFNGREKSDNFIKELTSRKPAGISSSYFFNSEVIPC